MQTSCDPPLCKSYYPGDPLTQVPLSPDESGAPKPSKIAPNLELSAKAQRCLMGHCLHSGKSQGATKCSERTTNGEERKVKNVGTGTGKMPQKAEHRHHAHHLQGWWMLPHDAVSRGIQR